MKNSNTISETHFEKIRQAVANFVACTITDMEREKEKEYANVLAKLLKIPVDNDNGYDWYSVAPDYKD